MLLRFRFNTTAVARMNELADKNRKGTIDHVELRRLLIRAGHFAARNRRAIDGCQREVIGPASVSPMS